MFETINHNEVTYHGRRIIIDTCRLLSGEYETMAMYPNGHDLDTFTTLFPEEARENHRQLLAKYTEVVKQLKPLSGRYLQLSHDLAAAAAVALKASARSDDEGTCNLDTAVISLPRWQGEKIKQAAEAAGVRVSAFEWFGSRRYFVFVDAAGQANRRTAAAEAMAQALRGFGYSASVYYQAD